MSTKPVKADCLREARVYLGFSRDEVAGAMGCERRWVDDIEHGRTTVTGEELRKLARLYRRPVGWFTGEWEFHPDPGMVRQLNENPRLTEGDREAVLDFAEFLQGAGPAPVPPAEQARRAAWRRSLRNGTSDTVEDGGLIHLESSVSAGQTARRRRFSLVAVLLPDRCCRFLMSWLLWLMLVALLVLPILLRFYAGDDPRSDDGVRQ